MLSITNYRILPVFQIHFNCRLWSVIWRVNILCFCIVVDMTRDEEFSNRLNNRSNFRGCTSLHYAVLMDSEVIVQMLLDAG